MGENLKITTKITRSKRSPPLKFSGDISKLLFGVLNGRDREELENYVEITANNTNELAKLLMKQTQIIDNKFQGLESIAYTNRKEIIEIIDSQIWKGK